MKIWIQSSVFMPTPPPKTGALEYLVAQMAGGLASRGHDVTLFAAPGSDVDGVLTVTTGRSYSSPVVAETALIDAMERYPKPDVLFDHSRWQLAQRRWPAMPAVTMSHGNAPIESYAKNAVFVSKEHGRWHGRKEPTAIHLGIDASEFHVGGPLRERGPVLWIGRIMEYKRLHLAIDLCRRAGIRLNVAGPVGEADYFEGQVKPLLDTGVANYVGEVAGQRRLDLYSTSAALLFTSEAKEPAGAVMLEAMASGTPVLAFDHGANPEYVFESETGLLAESEEVMVELLRSASWMTLDPVICRHVVEEAFSVDAMVERAERVLDRAVEGERWE